MTGVDRKFNRLNFGVDGWEVKGCLLVWLLEKEEADVGEDADALLPLWTEETFGEELQVWWVVSIQEVSCWQLIEQTLILLRQIVLIWDVKVDSDILFINLLCIFFLVNN